MQHNNKHTLSKLLFPHEDFVEAEIWTDNIILFSYVKVNGFDSSRVVAVTLLVPAIADRISSKALRFRYCCSC